MKLLALVKSECQQFFEFLGGPVSGGYFQACLFDIQAFLGQASSFCR